MVPQTVNWFFFFFLRLSYDGIVNAELHHQSSSGCNPLGPNYLDKKTHTLGKGGKAVGLKKEAGGGGLGGRGEGDELTVWKLLSFDLRFFFSFLFFSFFLSFFHL